MYKSDYNGAATEKHVKKKKKTNKKKKTHEQC